MQRLLFILDRNNEVVGSLNSDGDLSRIATYFDDEYVQDLGTGAETFKFSTLADSYESEYLVAGNSIAFKEDGEFKLFNIIQIEETHEETFIKTVYCEMAGIELINEVVRPMKVNNSSLRKFLTTILEGTEWQLGIVDTRFSEVHDFEITDFKSVYELIQEYAVGTFGAEISYRVKISNGNIVGKYIDCYVERGNSDGFRFAYGSNLTSVTRTVDMSNLATALIGVGKSNLTFKEVETSDKPLTQDFIENKDAFKRWNINGSHIFGIHKAETDSPHELLKLTRIALEERANPQIKYEMKVELLGREVKIGDTVYVIDHEFTPPLHLSARVNQLTTSKTDPYNDEVVLANFKEVVSNISDEMRQIASELEGYVDGQFPIGGDKIENGAIDKDKLSNGQIITGTHLFANSITADKIQAGEIKAQHIETGSIIAEHLSATELITETAQIGSAVIDTVHIKEGAIDTVHINDGSITSAKIGNAEIGTAQIKDLEVTVAKVQEMFVNDLVAQQGKFESAHIGVLTAENIDAKTINAEHITASVIDAINMNVEGKITADRIDVSSLVVDDIDAGKITTGTLNADRITSSVITAINGSFENVKIDSAKIGELSADMITSGSISTDILKSNIIDAINMTVEGKITADKIDVNSIVVDNIDAKKITTGTLDAERIKGSVVQAVNMSAQKISANNIDVEGIKIGSANILEGEVKSINIGKGQISNAHIESAFIADAYIKKLDAGKITTGTLDCSNLKVTNLNAESITAGSITIQGANLTQNSMWLTDFTHWSNCSNKWTIDGTKSINGANAVKIEVSGETADTNNYLIGNHNINGRNTGYKCTKGDTFVASGKFFVPSDMVIDGAIPYLGIWFYGVNSDGTLTTVKSSYSPVNLNIKDSWQTVVHNSVCPEGATYVKTVINFRRNGKLWVAQPMLSRGTLSGIYQPHTDEQLSDGAIDNDKLAPESITSDKLVLEEIWASEGFIANFKSQSIDAGQITTGKISGEFLDIEGFVKFSDLDPEISDNFVRPVDDEGNILGTYINGATIHTGTLHGDQIIANGFTAKDKLNNTTFNIDKVTGEVTMSGEVKSMNYSEIAGSEQGYMLDPSGNAYLNNATVRGNLITPDAGVTNYGGRGNKNLLKRTDYDFLSLEQVQEYWALSSVAGTTNKISKYVGGANEDADSPIVNRKILRNAFDCSTSITSSYLNPLGENKREYITLEPNTNYTFSAWVYKGGNCDRLNVILWAYDNDGANRVQIKSTSVTEYKGKFEKVEFTFTTDDRVNYQIRLYNVKKTTVTTGESVVYLYQPKLELGKVATDYNSHEDDRIKYVRFWAGSDYTDRESAPFVVYSDGSIKATEGTFGGVFSGRVNIGNIFIEDDDKMEGSIDIKNNDDSQIYVHLNEKDSYFRSNLEIGDDFVTVDTTDRAMSVKKGTTTFTGANNKYTTIPATTGVIAEYGYTSADYGDYKHELWYTQGTLHHNAFGTKKAGVPDYRFCRDRGKSQTTVEVQGELKVTDKITMNNNIAIVARQDAGNSGFDYVVN